MAKGEDHDGSKPLEKPGKGDAPHLTPHCRMGTRKQFLYTPPPRHAVCEREIAGLALSLHPVTHLNVNEEGKISLRGLFHPMAPA